LNTCSGWPAVTPFPIDACAVLYGEASGEMTRDCGGAMYGDGAREFTL